MAAVQPFPIGLMTLTMLEDVPSMLSVAQSMDTVIPWTAGRRDTSEIAMEKVMDSHCQDQLSGRNLKFCN